MERDLEDLQLRIEEIAQATGGLKSAAASLRRPGCDVMRISSKVQIEEEKAKRAIKIATEIIQRKAKETTNAQNRMRFEKLSRDFSSQTKSHSIEIKTVAGLIRDMQQRAAIDEDVHTSRNLSAGSSGASELVEPLIKRPSGPQITSLELELQAEKLEGVLELNKDLEELNKLFEDMGILVAHQGTLLETIEGEIQDTQQKVTTGVQELDKAKSYQKSARKKIFCIMCCLVICLAVVFGFLGGFKLLQ